MEGAAHPAWKEGRRSKGGVPGPRSLTPSSSSYRGVSSLLQNPTGEGPGPLGGLHPLRKAPFVPNTRGPGRGTEAWAWTDLQTCPEDRWSVCARARVCVGGAGSRSCAMHHQNLPPKPHQHSGRAHRGWTPVAARYDSEFQPKPRATAPFHVRHPGRSPTRPESYPSPRPPKRKTRGVRTQCH